MSKNANHTYSNTSEIQYRIHPIQQRSNSPVMERIDHGRSKIARRMDTPAHVESLKSLAGKPVCENSPVARPGQMLFDLAPDKASTQGARATGGRDGRGHVVEARPVRSPGWKLYGNQITATGDNNSRRNGQTMCKHSPGDGTHDGTERRCRLVDGTALCGALSVASSILVGPDISI